MVPVPDEVDGVPTIVASGVAAPPLAAAVAGVDDEGGGIVSTVEWTGPAPPVAGALQNSTSALGQVPQVDLFQ
jgi:hypothetical protein